MKIGLFGIGLDTYWDQFDGLKDRLVGYQEQIAARIAELSEASVENAGLVDSPERAAAVGNEFRSSGVDVIFLYITN